MKTIDTNIRFNDSLTTQELFDLAVMHLGTMKDRSTVFGTCVYRGENNSCCAVGYFISDDEYTPTMEGKGVYSLAARADCPRRIKGNEDLLYFLQRTHDSTKYWEDNRKPMGVRFVELAASFELDGSIVQHPDLAWNHKKE